jgi:lipoate-protein ligase A
MTSALADWRYLTDDSVGGAEGLAFDEALAASHTRDGDPAPITLRLYTYRNHVALCGRFQHLEAEIDVDACRETGTEFNRRPTGGGAIVMGEGQLGVGVCAPAPIEQSPKAILLKYSEGIVAGLARIGVEASFGGKNDLKVDGRKIAGLGLFLDGNGGLLFHSSILADLNTQFMLDVLDIPAAKLGGAAVGAVERRVTTVTRETGREWTGKSLRDVIAEGFAEAMGVELADGQPTDVELERTADLVESKYQTDDWIFQRSPTSDSTGSAMIKTPGGLVRLYLAMSGDTIKSALFAGDFNQLPAALSEFESRLKWSRLDEQALDRLATDAMPDGSGLGVDNNDMVRVVLDAGRRVKAVEVAAPSRTGSCYFPDSKEDEGEESR